MPTTKNPQATIQGILAVVPPFDFGKSLEYLRVFPPTATDQAVSEDSFIKAFQVQGRTLVASVSAPGEVPGVTSGEGSGQAQLSYTVYSNKTISDEIESDFVDRVSSMLSLSQDLMPFYEIVGRDPLFQPVLQSLFGYHPVRFQSGFEAAVWAVLSQRNRMATARNMYRNLVRSFGHSIELDGMTFWAFPEPHELAGCSEGDLAMVARNLRRGEFLIDTAQAFAMVPPDFLAAADFEEVEEWLRGINGIGPWSASFVLWRGLGRSQTVPLPDRAFLDAASRVYGGGTTLSDAEVLRIARRYHPWQGYWAHYLRMGA